MSVDLSVTVARRVSVGLIGLALTATGALVSAPAQALSTPTAPARSLHAEAADPECLVPASRTTKWRRGADTTEVSDAVKAEVAQVLAAQTATPGGDRISGRAGAAAAIPGQIRVPVYIHVIHGTHRREKRITKRKARKMFRTLRYGFAGTQDGSMAHTGFVFDRREITIHRNDAWFHAKPFSRADRQMKKRLHRGKARSLNIYVNRPKSSGQLLLGFSLFPWQRGAHPKLDGVTVSEISLPGGRARGYNSGDTVIHETGHWLGLLHTFEGGCGDADGVVDTPAEAEPSFTCPIGRNSCPDADATPDDPTDPPTVVPDPVQNFMDYSYDSCMNHFTPGQAARMKQAFVAFRARR